MKKRSLSIYFVSVLLLINFLFSDGIRFSSADQLFPAIYQNGTQITELSLSALEKTTLSVRAADAYQWQALIPYSEQWVDIRGEADATCEISHPITAYSKEYVGHVFDPKQTWVNTQGVTLEQAKDDKWVVEYTKNTEKGCYEATGNGLAVKPTKITVSQRIHPRKQRDPNRL